MLSYTQIKPESTIDIYTKGIEGFSGNFNELEDCQHHIYNATKILSFQHESLMSYNYKLNHSLDVSNFPKGMYILQIHNNNEFYNKKIIIF